MTLEELDIKMKEDAIKLKEADITDTLKSIESEHVKSSLVLVFSATFFGIVLEKLSSLPMCAALFTALFLLAAVGFALYNIWAKAVSVHTNLDKLVSGESKPSSWEEYVNHKYEHLSKTYETAKGLLYNKATLTKVSFTFLAIALLLLIIFQFTYGRTQYNKSERDPFRYSHERGFEQSNQRQQFWK